jgi:GNAT superfamily N-acetyltransferase
VPIYDRAVAPDVPFSCRLDAHAALAWPAVIQERTGAGWLLRATPELDRGRLNNALPPCRTLEAGEIAPALAEVERFAARHAIRAGVQVSPIRVHDRLLAELARRGWSIEPEVIVLGGGEGERSSGGECDAGGRPGAIPEVLVTAGEATPEWLAAWARCEPGRDSAAHARTVLRLLRGRATFARFGDEAVGISVESDGLVGLFSIAVDPQLRRTGLGTATTRALMRRAAGSIPYIQVEGENAAALAMYRRLGFEEAYRYRHCRAPADETARPMQPGLV